jgi:tripartite-type tricarboxylate transporter receptor subunit TctC
MWKHIGPAITTLALVASFSEAGAQGFYAGKQLTILVNFEPGGAATVEARLLAQHIHKHIPGNPKVIVQNMGGAAGLIAAMYLGEIAPRDGSMVGYFTAAAQRYVSNPERFKVDFRTYEFIAVVPSGRIHFMRTDVKPGIRTAPDIVKAQDLVVGGLGPQQPKDMAMRLTLDLLGAPYTYVTGYNSSAQAMLALMRGEISYYSDSPSLYKSKIDPLVKSGELIPVFYDPAFDGAEFSTPKYMTGYSVPAFHELHQQIKNKMPEGPLWEAYKSMLLVNGTMYRLLALPPGAPKEAVDALREAVMRVSHDPEFIAEAQKVLGDVPEYVSGPNLNENVRNGLTISPELKAFTDDYVKKAGNR